MTKLKIVKRADKEGVTKWKTEPSLDKGIKIVSKAANKATEIRVKLGADDLRTKYRVLIEKIRASSVRMLQTNQRVLNISGPVL